MKKLFFLLVFLVSTEIAFAQFYSIGQDPDFTIWNTIKFKKISLIYPEQAKPFAERVIKFADNDSLLKILECYKTKFPLILHPFNSVSNGMVIWAPKRSEFYTMPDQSLYPILWHKQLVIHEFRHIGQMSLINSGISKLGSVLLGQQYIGGIVGLCLPPWLLEGDAVWFETKYSESGRGRMADFLMEPAALFDRNIHLNYEKSFFGSYKNFIPNHYSMGYLNVAYGYEKINSSFWSNAIVFSGRNLSSTNRFVKKKYGKNINKFTKDAQIGFKKKFDLIHANSKDYTKVNIKGLKDDYVNYEYPFYVSSNKIIALKSGLSYSQQFVLIDSLGEESELLSTGYVMESSVDCKNDKLIWAEQTYNVRWENVSYSDLFVYNIKTGTIRRISKSKYYYAPSWNSDNSKIAVSENDPSGDSKLIIVNAQNKSVVFELKMPQGNLLFSPKFVSDTVVVAIIMSEQGKGIYSINLKTAQQNIVLKPSFFDISNLMVDGETIYFESTKGSARNIHSIKLNSADEYELTNVRYGAKNPFVQNKQLLFSEYGSNGYRVASLGLDSVIAAIVETQTNIDDEKYFGIDTSGLNILKYSNGNVDNYKSKKYIKGLHLLNIHSWAPVFFNPSDNSILNGFSILSQNNLSTASAVVGVYKRTGDLTYTNYVNFEYKCLATVFDGIYQQSQYQQTTDTNSSVNVKWKSYSINASNPLNFSRGSFHRKMTLYYSYRFDQYELKNSDYWYHIEKADIGLQLYSMKRMAVRDLRPEFGIVFTAFEEFMADAIPFYKNDTLLDMAYCKSSFYLPGLLKHHSILLEGAYQKKIKGNNIYALQRGRIEYPGLYTVTYRKELYYLNASYRFPLCYPDFKLATLTYIKRIDINLFDTYLLAKDLKYNTVGIDLNFETHFFRFVYPFNFGFRFLYSPELNKFGSEFITFSTNF
ncbi:MAG: hypothetical protein WCK02_09075 [Bacteroidota bacterium]